VLLAIVTLWIVAIAWALNRLSRPDEERAASTTARPKPTGAVAGVAG
jgi:hypothetical protein